MITSRSLILSLFLYIVQSGQRPNFNTHLSEEEQERLATKRQQLIRQANTTIETTRLQLGYFAICVVAKDEHLYIEEWIQYHIWKGASKIYLYDNGSKPPMINGILEYVDSGHVDYVYYKHSHEADDYEIKRLATEAKISFRPSRGFQKWAYDSCMAKYAHRHQFIGLFDIDEFLVTPDNLQMKMDIFLKDYEDFGGIVVERRFFGPSGHTQTPNTTVLESYTKCTQSPTSYFRQRYPKQIINVKYFDGHCFAHYCSSRRPSVNTLKIEDTKQNRYDGLFKVTWEKLVIYHYFTKSFEDLFHKYLRKPEGQSMPDTVRENQQKYYNEVVKHTNSDCLKGIQLKKLCCPDLVQRSRNTTIQKRFKRTLKM